MVLPKQNDVFAKGDPASLIQSHVTFTREKSLLSEDVKKYFEGTSFAFLCLSLDLGAGSETVLLLKSTRDLLEGLKAAAAPVRVGWKAEQTPAGPVACLCLLAQDPAVGELFSETYFDVGDDGDRELLTSLSAQPRLKAAFFGEETELVWLADVPWGDLERLVAEQVFDRAEAWLEDTEEPDFDRARTLFQETVSLERLRESLHDNPS